MLNVEASGAPSPILVSPIETLAEHGAQEALQSTLGALSPATPEPSAGLAGQQLEADGMGGTASAMNLQLEDFRSETPSSAGAINNNGCNIKLGEGQMNTNGSNVSLGEGQSIRIPAPALDSAPFAAAVAAGAAASVAAMGHDARSRSSISVFADTPLSSTSSSSMSALSSEALSLSPSLPPSPSLASPSPSAAAMALASRTICLRALRGKNVNSGNNSSINNSSSNNSSNTQPPSSCGTLSAWGGKGGSSSSPSTVSAWGGKGGSSSSPSTAVLMAVAAAAAALPAASADSQAGAVGSDDGGGDGDGDGGGGGGGSGGGVLPSANKIVDLREVKKVMPMPLAKSAGDSEGYDDYEEEGEGDGGGGAGPVKVDLSAGKRMIEFQLKLNAADEKRELARLKSEKDRADAAASEGSQRMLAQINARMEAQRKGRGGLVGGWASDGEANTGEDRATVGGSWGARAVAQRQILKLARKHGIGLRFVDDHDDDSDASGVSKVRALARAHGIRILVVGQEDDVGGDGSGGGVASETPGRGVGGGLTVAQQGGGGEGEVGDKATPPPLMSSLRPREVTVHRRSPSPVPQSSVKTPGRKSVGAPTITREGGMFSGPARMMRRALEASGGCVPAVRGVITTGPTYCSRVG